MGPVDEAVEAAKKLDLTGLQMLRQEIDKLAQERASKELDEKRAELLELELLAGIRKRRPGARVKRKKA